MDSYKALENLNSRYEKILEIDSEFLKSMQTLEALDNVDKDWKTLLTLSVRLEKDNPELSGALNSVMGRLETINRLLISYVTKKEKAYRDSSGALIALKSCWEKESPRA